MAENERTVVCVAFVNYMTGKLTEVERKRYERHLTTCAQCREDAAEWSRVWHRLSEEVPLLSPPSDTQRDMRDAVIGKTASFSKLAASQPLQRPAERRFFYSLRWFLMAIALAVAFWAGFLVNAFV